MALAAVALVTMTLAATVALAAPTITVKDGVTRVANGAQPSKGREVVALQEVWRVGGDEGEDFFGLITQVRTGKDGRIYLLDTRLAEVPVYDKTGARVATLSREGDGPGESRLPANLVFMPDGTLGLAQIFPGKIIKINLDGSPAGSFTPGAADPTAGGFLQLFDCITSGPDLVVTAEAIAQGGATSQDRTNYVATVDAAGKEKVRFLERKNHMDFTAFEFNEDKTDRVDFRKVAAGKDGRVYVAGYRNRYAIDVYGKDGKLQRVIERAYEHKARTDEEHQRLVTAVQGQPGPAAGRQGHDVAHRAGHLRDRDRHRRQPVGLHQSLGPRAAGRHHVHLGRVLARRRVHQAGLGQVRRRRQEGLADLDAGRQRRAGDRLPGRRDGAAGRRRGRRRRRGGADGSGVPEAGG
ncbi:MAG: hypothetical protein IPK64_01280 [bacterium]|nr:hypothetical protein [bacterium]